MAAPSGRGHLWFLALALTALLAVVGPPKSAQATELEAGVVSGVNWSLLSQPADPAGQYTFLWGSAFSGVGATWGSTLFAPVYDRDGGGRLALNFDVLHGYQRGVGWADHGELGRVDVVLSTHVIRLPVLVRWVFGERALRPTAGVGVEPLIGVSTGADVSERGVDGQLQQIETAPHRSVAAVAALGLEFDTAGGRTVPIEFRAAFDPFVESSTEERFMRFEDADNPGRYQVGFDWYLSAMIGVRWSLGG